MALPYAWLELVIQPLLLGLSSGIFCFSLCFPLIVPLLAAEERKPRQNARLILEFLAGRFFVYVLFGALSGYLGTRFSGRIWELGVAVGISFLSILLILYGVGRLGWGGRAFCLGPGLKRKTPFFMGFFMGLNACPPFLMSLGTVMSFHDIFKGMFFFFIFFLGTSVYFLPGLLIGMTGKMKEFRLAAQLSAVVVGSIYLIYNTAWVFRYVKI